MAQPVRQTARQANPRDTSLITSRENRWLKRFRAALSGERDENGNVGVEGVRLVEAALASGLPVEALLVSTSGARHLPRIVAVLPTGTPVLRTTDRLFAGVADTQTPQGIAALVSPRQATIEGMVAGVALIVALLGVQDPGNVGTILRAAEAFGATGAVTCPAGGVGTADPYGPKALRASAGSTLRLPVVHGVSPAILLTQLRVFRVCAYAAVAQEQSQESVKAPQVPSKDSAHSLSPWEVDWTNPAAILIGNEGAGLPDELARSADSRVHIPQHAATAPNEIESLNAAMAASVLLYEAMRQRTAAQTRTK